MVKAAVVAISSVYPSGGAFATMSAPMLPPGSIDLPSAGRSNTRADAYLEVQLRAGGDLLVNIKREDGSIIESAYGKTAFLSLNYKNGLAVNGKDILLKGVAAHEFHPINGNILDKQ